MKNKIPHTDLFTEASNKIELARKYHQSLRNDCNYIRKQIFELQSRLAEKEVEQTASGIGWKRALETLKQINLGN